MNSPPQPDPWIGRSIGARQRYRLEKRLAAGGMGDVFVAMDTLLGQQVALKLLKDTLVESEELRKRFEREVAVSAALKSNHIVEVSDHGVTAEGHPFYVMEYLRGQSLRELLRSEKQVSVERTVNLISQVCEGLRLAHEGLHLWRNGANKSDLVKVVHRDLKPDNIFVVPTTLGELVKILDFGIAKIRKDNAEHTNLTDMFIGTFRYAAPEQLAAKKDLDARADIYSLGIILYEMLSETDPFGLGLNTNKISEMSWAVAHTTKQPQPLRSQPGCEHIEPQLEAVVMRCLQKSPDERFATVDELKRALQAAIAVPRPLTASGQGVNTTSAQTPPPPPPTQAVSSNATNTQNQSLLFRKSHLVLIGSGIAIVILTFGIYYLSQSPNQLIAPEAKPIVKEPKFSLANNLVGHLDSVWSVAISPNGQTLASGSEDKTIKIWSLGDGNLLRTLAGHTDTVRAVAISRDGQTLASGSGDKTIKIWRLGTGELIHTLSGHADAVWFVAISPDGQTLVSASFEGIIKLWSVDTGKLLHSLSGHSDSVWSVAISPDGQTLASGSQDKTIKIWRGTGELLRTLSGHLDSVRAVAISPDGQTLASGSGDKTIKIWNLHNGKLLRTLSGHTSRVVSIAISRDGQTLVSSSLDKTIKIWRLSTGELLSTLSGHSDWVLSVAISPSGQTLVSGSKDQTIKIWRR